MKDDAIAPVLCRWCGQKIPDSRRRHGSPPKTCSDECRKARAAQKEKERYKTVKDTPEWKAVRENYLQRLKERLAADPEYAALFRAYADERTRKWRNWVMSDPAYKPYREQTLAEKRRERAEWRGRLLDEPMAWEAHKFKARAWYAGLSAEDRGRIFYEPARRRSKDKPDKQG